MKRILFGIVLLVLLAVVGGCASTGGPQPSESDARALAGPMPDPAEAEQLIFNSIKVRLKDPDSIKQFRISRGPIFVNTDVWVGLLNGGTRRVIGWVYCAEYNAKNSYGAYAGVEDMEFLVHNRYGPRIVETARGCS